MPRLLLLRLLLVLAPGGRGWAALEVLLLFVALLILATAAVVLGRGSGRPPLLLLGGLTLVVLVVAVAAAVAAVAVLGRGATALLGGGRGVRGGLVGGGPSAALGVGGIGVAAGAGAGEADAGEDAGLGLGRRRLRLGGLRLVPRRGRRRGRRQREVVVAVGGGALLARAGGAVRGAPRVPVVGAGRRRRGALRPVRLGMGPRPLQGKNNQKKTRHGTTSQYASSSGIPNRVILNQPIAIVRPKNLDAQALPRQHNGPPHERLQQPVMQRLRGIGQHRDMIFVSFF